MIIAIKSSALTYYIFTFQYSQEQQNINNKQAEAVLQRSLIYIEFVWLVDLPSLHLELYAC